MLYKCLRNVWMVPCITGWARFLSKVSLITEFPMVAAFNLRLYFALWLVHNTKIKIINMPWNTLKPTSHRIMTVSSDMAALMKLGSTPSVKICIKYRKQGRYSFASKGQLISKEILPKYERNNSNIVVRQKKNMNSFLRFLKES